MEKIQKFNEWKKEEKVIINAFLCYRNLNNEQWDNCLNKYKDLKSRIDWWVKPQLGHHLGLAFQSILNTDDMGEALNIAKSIYDEFDKNILVVISKGMVRNYEPVGENFDDAFVGCGRYFDKMVRKKEKGIYIWED